MLAGMIIGVGMFGIPFSFAQAGFWLGALELAVLAGIVLLLHLLYGEIVLHTPSLHRLPGYIRLYLGRRAAGVAWGSAFFGISGTLLAYLVLGSIFLKNIFGSLGVDASLWWWVVVFAGAGAIITSFPLRREALANGVLTAVLVGLLLLFVAILIPRVEPLHFSGISPAHFFVPYGVLLFALSGGTVIPDVVTVLGRARRMARYAIAVGTLIPALLYFAFAYGVVGVSGGAASKDALAGLAGHVAPSLLLMGSIIGFLAVFTSFIVLNGSFQALLKLDLGISRTGAWGLGVAIPLALYLLGFQDFFVVIGAVGAIAGGIDIILVIAAYHRARHGARPVGFLSYAWKGAIAFLMLAGVGYEFLTIIF